MCFPGLGTALLAAGASASTASAASTAATWIGIAGSGLSAIGTVAQGLQQRKVANAQAKVEERQARRVEEQGSRREGQENLQRARERGKLWAAPTGLNFRTGQGDFQSMFRESAQFQQETIADIRRNAHLQAADLREQASLTRQAGKNAFQASLFQGVGGFIGGVGRAFAGAPGGAQGDQDQFTPSRLTARVPLTDPRFEPFGTALRYRRGWSIYGN